MNIIDYVDDYLRHCAQCFSNQVYRFTGINCVTLSSLCACVGFLTYYGLLMAAARTGMVRVTFPLFMCGTMIFSAAILGEIRDSMAMRHKPQEKQTHRERMDSEARAFQKRLMWLMTYLLLMVPGILTLSIVPVITSVFAFGMLCCVYLKSCVPSPRQECVVRSMYRKVFRAPWPRSRFIFFM